MKSSAVSCWRLLTLLCGFVLMGKLLPVQHIPLTVWIIVEALILYLSWSGTGAIALSTVTVTGMMWALTLSKWGTTEVSWLNGEMLSPAQVWAIGLILSWLLAIVLTFGLGFAAQHLMTTDCSKMTALCLLILVANLGLKLGQMLEIKMIYRQ